jgi:hypothetical protein
MNVYSKLQKVRVELKSKPIKESGNNKFAGYTYMELGDFLPIIVELCNDAGLCPVISFAEMATLTVVNCEKPEEKIVFTSPMSTAQLKGCHEIQNLGAVETYLRRYLYVAAFDIVEHDALDSTQGKDKMEQRKEAARSAAQGQNSGTGNTPPASEDDAEYIAEIHGLLKSIFGDDKAGALAKVQELTTFPEKKDGKATGKMVEGVRDYRTLKGKRLEILCHNLRKLSPPKEETCPICAGILEDGKCWEINCEKFAG